jgi:hypothetical protein
MIPIAEDNQQASKGPVILSVPQLLMYSVFLGLLQSLFTLIFYIRMEDFLSGPLDTKNTASKYEKDGETVYLYSVDGYYCNGYAQSAIWLQISIAAELLIFVARAPGLFFLSRPSNAIIFSTLVMGALLSSLLAVYAFPGEDSTTSQTGMRWKDVGIIWAYDLGCLFILDLLKLAYKQAFEHSTDGVIDEAKYLNEDMHGGHGEAEEMWNNKTGKEHTAAVNRIRASTTRTATERMSEFLVTGKSMSDKASMEHGHMGHFSSQAVQNMHGSVRQERERTSTVATAGTNV